MFPVAPMEVIANLMAENTTDQLSTSRLCASARNGAGCAETPGSPGCGPASGLARSLARGRSPHLQSRQRHAPVPDSSAGLLRVLVVLLGHLNGPG